MDVVVARGRLIPIVKSKQCNSGPARERYLGGKFYGRSVVRGRDLQGSRSDDGRGGDAEGKRGTQLVSLTSAQGR